ncbi:YbaY family lipoprotein [Mesorhizobium sp. SP-1A]|uniref:YbaY family lipoprotein n=1 Tax=Mesorhizobium sp. SP-1A TaxID=3077840 RepID=UPI0028F714BA|nr:YbaY family lipoprotein [Mesorhizobium sp. SP-1A]
MLDRIAEFFIFGFAPLMAGILTAPEVHPASEHVLKGKVWYPDHVKLPANAILTVQLRDLSSGDRPDAVIAEQQIGIDGEPPIRFALRFRQSAIKPRIGYGLRAHVSAGNEMLLVDQFLREVDPLTDSERIVLLAKTSAK